MKSFYGFGILCVFFFTEVYSQKTPFDSFLNKCEAEKRGKWSYKGLNGPPFWGLEFKKCYGYEQSPVELSRISAVKDENLEKLTLTNYDQQISQGKLQNNGHAVQVDPNDGISRTISVNGYEYSLQQFHFHWGDVYSKGSEHTLDDTQYAMEVHFVHTNASGNIAVVGVLFQEQDNDNEELQKIVDHLSDVKYKGDEKNLETSINLNKLLPANPTSYFRYQGSLTTPPCTEGVTWSVATDPITVGRDQMKKFRELYSANKDEADDNCKLINNYRPLQLLFKRRVSLSL